MSFSLAASLNALRTHFLSSPHKSSQEEKKKEREQYECTRDGEEMY